MRFCRECLGPIHKYMLHGFVEFPNVTVWAVLTKPTPWWYRAKRKLK